MRAWTSRLRQRIDLVVPEDGFPSATQAGGVEFWTSVAATERPEWAAGAGAGAGARPEPGDPAEPAREAGTCQMRTDPAHSVTDSGGRVCGHDNLRVIDGSLHVTNGGVNPVLTIYANAMRIMDRWLH